MNLKGSVLFEEYAEVVQIKRGDEILYPSIRMLIQPDLQNISLYKAHVVYIDENKDIKKGDIVLKENGDRLRINRVSTLPNIDFGLLDLTDE